MLAVTQFLSERKRGSVGSAGVLSGFLLFLALLARPDALLIFAALAVIRYLRGRSSRAGQIDLARWGAAFLVPTLLFFLARHAYYGSYLPNTYYAKSVGVSYGLKNGFPYLWHGLMPFSRLTDDLHNAKSAFSGHVTLSVLLLLGSLLVFWGLAVVGFRATPRRMSTQVCAAVVGALSVFVLLTGGDWMNGWRFMIPALPFFAILQVQGLRVLADRQAQKQDAQADAFKGQSTRYRLIGYLAVAGFWGVCLLRAPHITWAQAKFSTQGEALMVSDIEQNGPLEVAVGNYIHDHLKACKSIAYSEMGYATFVNMDRTFIDVHGLTNRGLAHMPKQYKSRIGFTDPNWRNPTSPLYKVLLHRHPDAIIVISKDASNTPVLGNYRPLPVGGLAQTIQFRDRFARIYLAPGIYNAPNAVARAGSGP